MDLLHVLGWSRSAMIIDQPTFVQDLIVPELSFHQKRSGSGDKAGLRWRDALFPDNPKTTGAKIYVSRSELDSSLGRFKNA